MNVVVSNGPGWLVVHAQKDGKTGPDIGHAALVDGLNKDVVVKLDPSGVTNVLYAMLHTDAGVVGTYEFPGADVPVSQSGNLVNKPFRIHPAAEAPVVGLEVAAQGLVAPIALVSPNDGTGRRFIVDQVGVDIDPAQVRVRSWRSPSWTCAPRSSRSARATTSAASWAGIS